MILALVVPAELHYLQRQVKKLTLHIANISNTFPLTWVKKLRVFPFFLIMVQGPQIDDDSGSFLYCEVSNAAKKHRERKAQWEANNPTRQRWGDAGDRARPLQGIDVCTWCHWGPRGEWKEGPPDGSVTLPWWWLQGRVNCLCHLAWGSGPSPPGCPAPPEYDFESTQDTGNHLSILCRNVRRSVCRSH